MDPKTILETLWLMCVELQIVTDRLNAHMDRIEGRDDGEDGWPLEAA